MRPPKKFWQPYYVVLTLFISAQLIYIRHYVNLITIKSTHDQKCWQHSSKEITSRMLPTLLVRRTVPTTNEGFRNIGQSCNTPMCVLPFLLWCFSFASRLASLAAEGVVQGGGILGSTPGWLNIQNGSSQKYLKDLLVAWDDIIRDIFNSVLH